MKNLFLGNATEFRFKHETIVAAKEFSLSDDDYDAFQSSGSGHAASASAPHRNRSSGAGPSITHRSALETCLLLCCKEKHRQPYTRSGANRSLLDARIRWS